MIKKRKSVVIKFLALLMFILLVIVNLLPQKAMASSKEEGIELFKQGITHYEKSEFDDALKKYKEALRIFEENG